MIMNIVNGFMKNIPVNAVKTMLASLFITYIEKTYYLTNKLVYKEQLTIINLLGCWILMGRRGGLEISVCHLFIDSLKK